MTSREPIRIAVWSGPRNISTALMYSFAQRDDTKVFDEPFYAHYLSTTDADEYHPGAEDVIASQENDWRKVLDEVILADHGAEVLFFKQMTHHIMNVEWSFLDKLCNVILTRDPRDMLPSYATNVTLPTLRDTGYGDHLKLLNYLRDLGQEPPVLDSKAVLLNPERVLNDLCDRIGIPFDPKMLHWEAGARPEDGVWAKYWYDSVHQSTGFNQYRKKTAPFPDHLKPLLAECQPYYEQVAALALGKK